MATWSSPNQWEPPAAGPRSNGPRSPWARVGLFRCPVPAVPWALTGSRCPPAPSPSCLCFAPPFSGIFFPPCLVGFAEHHESQRQALIRGLLPAPCQQHVPARHRHSRPPFLLRQEEAAGDVEPQRKSLQLGLFCCLPRLISFNYLSPFLSPSPSQILGFFQVMILLLSPQPWLALPVCLQLPTLLLLPSLPFCSPPDHPFSLLSWLHPARLTGSFFSLLF